MGRIVNSTNVRGSVATGAAPARGGAALAPEVLPSGRAARSWAAAGWVFLGAVLALVVANAEALHGLVSLWAFAGLEYGFVVAAISLWLLWRSRDCLRSAVPVQDWRALWLVLPVAAGTWLAYLLDVRIAQDVLFVAGLAALTWALLGPAVLRIAAGPLVFALLSLPIWNYFKPVLQAMTVRATAFALELTGTPTFVDEIYVHTPKGAIVVLSQCSGAQYFQAGVTLGALYAYLGFRSFRLRILVLIGFAAAAVVGNWIRVYVIVHLGKLTEWQHFLVGWGVFALLLVGVFAAGVRLQRREERSARALHSVSVPMTGPSSTRSLGTAAISALIVTLLLAAGPMAERWQESALPVAAPAVAPLGVRPPWSGPLAPDRSWQPSFAGAAGHLQATYHSSSGDVSAYWAWYPHQGRRSQVISQSNSVYTAPWEPAWDTAGSGYRQFRSPDGSYFEVVETALSNPQTGARRLVWHWYRIGGRGVVQPWKAKLFQVLGLLHGRADAVVVALSAGADDREAARSLLLEFALANSTSLHLTASRGSP